MVVTKEIHKRFASGRIKASTESSHARSSTRVLSYSQQRLSDRSAVYHAVRKGLGGTEATPVLRPAGTEATSNDGSDVYKALDLMVLA